MIAAVTLLAVALAARVQAGVVLRKLPLDLGEPLPLTQASPMKSGEVRSGKTR
jgi:hypothetical protein